MDCEGGNEADREVCEIELDRTADVASLYECDEDFDEFFACLEEEAHCEDGHHWTHNGRCDGFGQRFDRCVD